MSITLREKKGAPLTHVEMDNNMKYLHLLPLYNQFFQDSKVAYFALNGVECMNIDATSFVDGVDNVIDISGIDFSSDTTENEFALIRIKVNSSQRLEIITKSEALSVFIDKTHSVLFELEQDLNTIPDYALNTYSNQNIIYLISPFTNDIDSDKEVIVLLPYVENDTLTIRSLFQGN